MASAQLDAAVAAIREEDRKRGYSRLPRAVPPDDELRQRKALTDANALPIPGDVAMREGAVGGVPGLWFEPEGADRSQVILYCHGGGYMFGSPLYAGHMTARLARATGCVAFSVDYRLSFEAKFPAPVEDVAAAYRGLLAQGFASGAIVLAGDSAGAGLIVAAMVALRDAGVPLPAAGFSSSPWTDLTMSGDSIRECADTDVNCDLRGLEVMAEGYLGGADPRSPLASPLYADLAGLPPLLIQAGSVEVLRDDAVRLARRARAAGVEVTLEVIEGAVHIWQAVAPDAPETGASEQRAGAFLRRKLHAKGKDGQ